MQKKFAFFQVFLFVAFYQKQAYRSISAVVYWYKSNLLQAYCTLN